MMGKMKSPKKKTTEKNKKTKKENWRRNTKGGGRIFRFWGKCGFLGGF